MKIFPEAILNINRRISEISTLPVGILKEKTEENPFMKKEIGFHEHLQNALPDPAKTESKDNSIDAIIENQSLKSGLDPDLIRAMIKTESNFNPKAVSPKGAQGLMQLMPDTAAGLGVEDAFDPSQNIQGGAEYMKNMLMNFGQVEKALAAYNAGPGAVQKYGGVPPYKETEDYIKKVAKYYNSYKKQ